MKSFGECAAIVMKHLRWSSRTFVQKTGFSYKNCERFKDIKKSWGLDLVLSFCRASEESTAVAKCLFTAANMPLDPWLRDDHRIILDLIENHRGESPSEWNSRLCVNGIDWIKVKEITITN